MNFVDLSLVAWIQRHLSHRSHDHRVTVVGWHHIHRIRHGAWGSRCVHADERNKCNRVTCRLYTCVYSFQKASRGCGDRSNSSYLLHNHVDMSLDLQHLRKKSSLGSWPWDVLAGEGTLPDDLSLGPGTHMVELTPQSCTMTSKNIYWHICGHPQ